VSRAREIRQGSQVDAGQGSRGHGKWRSGDQASLGDQARPARKGWANGRPRIFYLAAAGRRAGRMAAATPFRAVLNFAFFATLMYPCVNSRYTYLDGRRGDDATRDASDGGPIPS
jgi:hypothetical protein